MLLTDTNTFNTAITLITICAIIAAMTITTVGAIVAQCNILYNSHNFSYIVLL